MSDQRDESGSVGNDQGRVVSKAREWLAPPRSFVHGWPGGRHVWRIGIAAAGLAVVLAGVVMLVIPGPGWLVIFLGFAIWATEFAWANSVASFVGRNVTACASWIRRRPRWWLVGVGSICLAAVGIVIVAFFALR